ncbi:unnamed protein product [Heligmosomoides polygyrus]|uniref:Uncharacterized protein n=1 Tax=Heligmosomoides polygyrus TaxID=6339 RepID=A0A183FMP7_HELPZ|nr:unnamed protein product [Heligmosomoides polygyrus]
MHATLGASPDCTTSCPFEEIRTQMFPTFPGCEKDDDAAMSLTTILLDRRTKCPLSLVTFDLDGFLSPPLSFQVHQPSISSSELRGRFPMMTNRSSCNPVPGRPEDIEATDM